MENSFQKLLQGYQQFRKKYASGDHSVMQYLSYYGQKPKAMIVSCCDSRVDPALILQCDPGDLFVVRNVANIIPPYEKDEAHHGTSAALEFGICFLQVNHLILLGHSQCGGIEALLQNEEQPDQTDFIYNWVSILKTKQLPPDVDDAAKLALTQSYKNCLGFPWIHERIQRNQLKLHLWFFDIKAGQISAYDPNKAVYLPLDLSI